jgi:hypothetical protein
VCRVKEKLREGTILVAGDQWPIVLYAGYRYDPEDPWNGLLRSNILVNVSFELFFTNSAMNNTPSGSKAYFY